MSHTMAHADPKKVGMAAGTGLVGVATMAALAGATAALLLAPKSGKDTRSELKRKMHEAKERSKQKTDDMKESASEKTEEMRSKAEDKTKEMSDKAAEARTQIDDIAAETTPRNTRSRRSTTL